ncbi:hypothetical protein E4T42_05207 [Aureobasidium subglaciale]|nr:hypothetical protein E4T42_05207 [Aureobasidium subglaciale]
MTIMIPAPRTMLDATLLIIPQTMWTLNISTPIRFDGTQRRSYNSQQGRHFLYTCCCINKQDNIAEAILRILYAYSHTNNRSQQIARLFTTTIEEKPSPSPEDRPSPIKTPVLPPTVFYFSEWYPGQFQVFFHITIIYGPLPVNQIMSTDTGLAGYERPSGVKFAACCHI